MTTAPSGTMLRAGVEGSAGIRHGLQTEAAMFQDGVVTTLWALDLSKRAGNAEDVRSEHRMTTGPGSEALMCVSCGHRITTRAHRLAVNGSHCHTFANPHGLVFRIGCFSTAPGCSIVGGDHMDFTWFAGYAWAMAECARCGSHVGWRFRSGAQDFHGLVRERLVEGCEPESGGPSE